MTKNQTKTKGNIQKSLIKRLFSSIWTYIIFLSTIGGLFIYPDLYHKWFTPKEKQFIEQNYLQGIAIAPMIIQDSTYINFLFSGMFNHLKIADIKSGIPFRLPFLISNDSTLFNLYVQLKNNTLYFSTKFYDLDGHFVGKLDYDKWEVRDNYISYRSASSSNYLEITDIDENIMFQIMYDYPNTILFSGYYLDADNINVITQNQLSIFPRDATGKLQAEKLLKKVKSFSH